MLYYGMFFKWNSVYIIHRERKFFTDLQKKRLTNESHIICVADPPQEENICGNFGKPLAFAPKIVYTIDMQ